MNDHDVHDRMERLMADEPPHRPLPDLVRAGERGLLRRRLSLGAGGVLAIAVVGLGAAVVAPSGDHRAARDETGFADTTSATPSATPTSEPSTDPEMGQTLDPNKRASYSYGTYSPCGNGPSCDRYQFRSKAARKPVVAAIEFRLIDGSSKRVDTDHGAYKVVINGTLPAGYRWDPDGGLVDAAGQSVDLFAGLTLFAADGSVLATATPTYSDELDPYLELK